MGKRKTSALGFPFSMGDAKRFTLLDALTIAHALGMALTLTFQPMPQPKPPEKPKRSARRSSPGEGTGR